MELKSHFIKTNDFKTITANGVHGGVTLVGQINMNFYSERVPIPNEVTYNVDETKGELIPKSTVTKEGTIREFQFGVLLDLNVAKATRDWLDGHISALESHIAQTGKK